MHERVALLILLLILLIGEIGKKCIKILYTYTNNFNVGVKFDEIVIDVIGLTVTSMSH